MALEVDIQTSKELDRLIRRLATRLTPNEIAEALLKQFDKLGAFLAGKVQENSLSGQRLNVRTNQLRNSVIGFGTRVNGIPAIRVGIFKGPSLAYAAIQEEGTVGAGGKRPSIVPKRAKALAVPLPAVEEIAGRKNRVGPRDFPRELRFLPFRNSGVAVGKLVDKTAADELSSEGLNPYDARTFYILMKKVDLPPTFWLSAPVRDAIPKIAQEILNFIRDLVSGRATI